MSNTIRYDSLLVRDLAAELNATLAGARLEALFIERDSLRVSLRTRAASRTSAAPPHLTWSLHPDSGLLTTRDVEIAGGRVQLAAGSRIARVFAPPDERIICFDLDTGNGPHGLPRRIIINLITNQWNAFALGMDDRIVALLRQRMAGGVRLQAGLAWALPASSDRPGALHPLALEEWIASIGSVPPGERLRGVLRCAWISAINAAWVIGDADVTDERAALVHAWNRYNTLITATGRVPCLLRQGGVLQPYSFAVSPDAERTASLLEAFQSAAAHSGEPADESAIDAGLDVVAQRIAFVERRIEKLRAEQEGAAQQAAELRQRADLLMANLHSIPRGAAFAELTNFEGNAVSIELDPSLNAASNAAALYDAARRRDRAAMRIPALLPHAQQELARLQELAARVRSGLVSHGEIEALRARHAASAAGAERLLPYRLYRTSHGTEVRVGRSSRANDDLTFRHSSPNDIWLHARDVAGAHVILRWPHATMNPSASDIAEAAVLAALHSRARTSGTVPVDWTRRKHVRKPRKSAPGQVLPERVRTVFVEPNPDLEARLRVTDLDV